VIDASYLPGVTAQDKADVLSFAIGVTPTETTLDISGPTDARPLIEALA
jgi:hypothetical protein